MARLHMKTPEAAPAEIVLGPGRNVLGREGANDFLVLHPSVSRHHCEVWLTEEAVMVRDLHSRNGTYVEGERVNEAQVFTGQILRIGEVEMLLDDAPTHISVPGLHLPHLAPKEIYLEDGSLCCTHHAKEAAVFECQQCHHVYCIHCVRELRVAGGVPRRFCPDCRGICERMVVEDKGNKRPVWFDKIVRVFTKPKNRRR